MQKNDTKYSRNKNPKRDTTSISEFIEEFALKYDISKLESKKLFLEALLN